MSARKLAEYKAKHGRLPYSTIQRKEKPCTSTGVRSAKSFGCAAKTATLGQKSRISFAKTAKTKSPIRKRKPIPSRKKRPRPVSKTQRLRLKALKLIRDRWWAEGKRTCGICGKEILERSEYTLDHIEPGSAKSDAEDNLQPAHWLCNHIKGSRRNFTLKGKRP
jgi:hypothetical protein